MLQEFDHHLQKISWFHVSITQYNTVFSLILVVTTLKSFVVEQINLLRKKIKLEALINGAGTLELDSKPYPCADLFIRSTDICL